MPKDKEPADPRKFYVVWSPQGGPPVARFPAFGAARTVAVRLSLKHPDRDFFVLASCWGRIASPAAAVEDTASDPSMAQTEPAP